MRLSVVGCSPAWPNPGGAHSGYLVEEPGRLLLDCGPGVLAKLREREDGWPQLDAIVISHWHLDHWGDLIPWVWGLMFGLGRDVTPLEVWVPPDGIDQLTSFGEQFGTPEMFGSALVLREYAEATPFGAAGFTITAFRVPHYTVPTYAFRVTDGERTLTYSGDSAPSESLEEAARGADLFLCEATLADDDPDNNPRGHLTAPEAAAAFEASGAKRLLLTHRPGELPVADSLELAQEGLILEL